MAQRLRRRTAWTAVLPLFTALLCGCGEPKPPSVRYDLVRVFEVEGRQGIATDGERYYVSGSKALFVYSKDGEQILANREPFRDLEKPANHIGDISVHDGKLYAGIEWFVDGRGKDIQIAVYDAASLAYERSFDWDPDSGQAEVSAVAVDPANGVVWMTDWTDGRYVYRYDLERGTYRGKLHLRAIPQWQQGIAVRDGALYITADDGDAEAEEFDNLWRAPAETKASAAFVTHERMFHDFERTGEIEGVAFDHAANEMLVHHNRGKRIVMGMPKGLYPGYDREIHEIHVYAISGAAR